MIMKWVTYQRGLAEGRRFYTGYSAVRGAIHPMRRGSTFSTLQGAGVKRRSPMWGSTTARTQTTPPKKTNTLFAAKNRRFFPNSSSHFDLFPSTSFPLSSLFQSVSSFCFVLVLPLFPFFCGEQEEGIDCVDLFCCLNYMQLSEKNKNLIWCLCSVKKTPHILLNPRRFEDASLQQGQRQIGYLWERRGKKAPSSLVSRQISPKHKSAMMETEDGV